MRIDGVEVFAAGKHNGMEFTRDDLSIMAYAASQLDYLPAVKLGHTDEKGAPAFGYLENLRTMGNKLIGDLTSLPQKLYQDIKDKRYGRVSLELLPNFERGGKKFKYAVKAIALLGQEIGAVHGLRPLTDMFSDSEHESVSFEFDFQEINMSDNDDVAKAEIAKLKKEMEAAKKKEADLKFQLEEANKKSTDFDDYVAQNKAALDASNKRIMELEQQSLNHSVQGKVDTVGLPALQPAFETLYRHALKHTDNVKMFSVDSKQHEDVTLEFALDSLVSFINDKAASLFSEKAGNHKPALTTYDDASVEVNKRVQKYLAENSDKDYSFAFNAVLAADDELKRAYTLMN